MDETSMGWILLDGVNEDGDAGDFAADPIVPR